MVQDHQMEHTVDLDDTAVIPATPPKRNLWVATGVGTLILIGALVGGVVEPACVHRRAVCRLRRRHDRVA